MGICVNIDWAFAWRQAQEARHAADDSDYWDGRAPEFRQDSKPGAYARAFCEMAAIKPGETVFDMGCGAGTIALLLAQDGHEVYAADFSSRMLEIMMQTAQERGISQRIHPYLLAWDDDWSKAALPVCDVALASRSIATRDLGLALEKLATKASRRRCVTLSCGQSPQRDGVLGKVMGITSERIPDFIYAMNILWQQKKMPTLDYIHSDRGASFNSFDEAIQKTCDAYDANPAQRECLIDYSKKHLQQIQTERGKRWVYDHRRVISWAFIAW